MNDDGGAHRFKMHQRLSPEVHMPTADIVAHSRGAGNSGKGGTCVHDVDESKKGEDHRAGGKQFPRREAQRIARVEQHCAHLKKRNATFWNDMLPDLDYTWSVHVHRPAVFRFARFSLFWQRGWKRKAPVVLRVSYHRANVYSNPLEPLSSLQRGSPRGA
jgi:hypothetical protein